MGKILSMQSPYNLKGESLALEVIDERRNLLSMAE
jgi:hypothetical protein